MATVLIAAVGTCPRLMQDGAHHYSSMDEGGAQAGLPPAAELLSANVC